MDTRTGKLYDGLSKMRQLFEERPFDVELFEHGETVQVKEGFFEVAKVDIRRQRIVLKPIPRPEVGDGG